MAPNIDGYVVYLKLTVMGENPEDALEYANSAIDNSDLLDQDGVIGIEVVDDVDTIEPVEDDYEDTDLGDEEY